MNPTTDITEVIDPDTRDKLRIERIMNGLHQLWDDDIEDQKATFSYLEKAINQDRLSTRKRFKS